MNGNEKKIREEMDKEQEKQDEISNLLTVIHSLGKMDKVGEKILESFEGRLLWGILEERMELIKHGDDWYDHQICGDFPQVDVRCFAFCCSPGKDCPYRKAALRFVGLSATQYTGVKAQCAIDFITAARKKGFYEE